MLLDVTTPLALILLLGLGVGLARSAILAGAATALLRLPWALRRRIFRLRVAPGQLRSELRAAVTVLLFDAAFFASVARFGGLRPKSASLAVNLLSFALLFAWYELWFYALHRALHTRLLSRIHDQHHTAHVVQPVSAFSFSLAERALLQLGGLGFVALASRFVPLGSIGLGAYMLVNYALNVLGHGNVEVLPASFASSAAGTVLVSPTFHALHHARLSGHYGLFTRVLDRAFGTEWSDYEAIHRRAAAGLGLRRLGERLENTPPVLAAPAREGAALA